MPAHTQDAGNRNDPAESEQREVGQPVVTGDIDTVGAGHVTISKDARAGDPPDEDDLARRRSLGRVPVPGTPEQTRPPTPWCVAR